MSDLTLEQVTAALSENNELQTQVFTQLKDTEIGKQIMNNFAQQFHEGKIGEVIGSKQREIWDSFDKLISGASGLAKLHGEKTSDFMTRAFGSVKNKDSKDEIEALKAKIKDYEENGSHNDHWKKTYDSAANEWKTKEQDYLSQLEAKDKELFSTTVGSKFDKAFSGMEWNPALKDAAMTTYNLLKGQLINNAKLEGDIMHYFNEKNELIRNPKTHAPATAEEVLHLKMSAFANKGQKGGGAGQGDKGGDGYKGKVAVDMSKVKTRGDFQAAFKSAATAQGIAVGTEDFTKNYSEAQEVYKYDSLPET